MITSAKYTEFRQLSRFGYRSNDEHHRWTKLNQDVTALSKIIPGYHNLPRYLHKISLSWNSESYDEKKKVKIKHYRRKLS